MTNQTSDKKSIKVLYSEYRRITLKPYSISQFTRNLRNYGVEKAMQMEDISKSELQLSNYRLLDDVADLLILQEKIDNTKNIYKFRFKVFFMAYLFTLGWIVYSIIM